MVTTLGTIHGTVQLEFNDAEPTTAATFELPVSALAIPTQRQDAGVDLKLEVDGSPIHVALAEALRKMADALDDRPNPSAEVDAALQGMHVLYVAHYYADYRSTFDRDSKQHSNDQLLVRRGRGMEEIVYRSGGSIRYVTPQGARGYSADVLSVPQGIPADVLANLMPTLATHPNRRIITRD